MQNLKQDYASRHWVPGVSLKLLWAYTPVLARCFDDVLQLRAWTCKNTSCAPSALTDDRPRNRNPWFATVFSSTRRASVLYPERMLSGAQERQRSLSRAVSPWGGADLRFLGPSARHQFALRDHGQGASASRGRARFIWYWLRLPTEGWPGWVDPYTGL